MDEVVMVGNDT